MGESFARDGNKAKETRDMKILLAMTALLSVACAPMTERERENREYQRVDYQAKYIDFRSRCQSKGGIILLTSTSRMRGSDLPARNDKYRCM